MSNQDHVYCLTETTRSFQLSKASIRTTNNRTCLDIHLICFIILILSGFYGVTALYQYTTCTVRWNAHSFQLQQFHHRCYPFQREKKQLMMIRKSMLRTSLRMKNTLPHRNESVNESLSLRWNRNDSTINSNNDIIDLSDTISCIDETNVVQQNNVTINETKIIMKQHNNIQVVVPSIKAILTFAIPAIGIWFCSPLLSMIDTATVGLYAPISHQAALNPATAITDYSARTLSFLYTGVTNIMATTKSQPDRSSSQPINDLEDNNDTYINNSHNFLGALQLSWIVGTLLGIIIFTLSSTMVQQLVGTNNQLVDLEVYEAAVKYVQIRSIGMPAAAMIGTSQAACFGLQDVISPLKLILFSSIINFILDLAFVRHPHSWIGGAAGVAWATIISQYITIGLFLRHLKGNNNNNNNSKASYNNTSNKHNNNKSKMTRMESPTKGYLSKILTYRSLFMQKPIRVIWEQFKPYIIPVTTTQIGRCSTYIAMGHVVSTTLGTISMAANQIISSIFYTLVPIGDSLSLTAQSLLPSILSNNQLSIEEKAKAIQQTTNNIMWKVGGGIFGLFLGSIVLCIPYICSLFTNDALVIDMVIQIVPILFIIFITHGIFCAAEGILLANRDLTFLGNMYAIFFVVVPYLMMRFKYMAQIGTMITLKQVWNLFLKYQIVRLTIWIYRVVYIQSKLNHEAKQTLEKKESG